MVTHLRRRAEAVDCEKTRRQTKSPEVRGTENAVESTVWREGGEEVDGEDLTGEGECGEGRTAGKKRRKRREAMRVSERNKQSEARRGDFSVS